jgi:hypothetical protein
MTARKSQSFPVESSRPDPSRPAISDYCSSFIAALSLPGAVDDTALPEL